MNIKATIVAYMFSVKYFKKAAIVAYAGLRVMDDAIKHKCIGPLA